MKSHIRVASLSRLTRLAAGLAIVPALVGCSVIRASEAPTTPFLTHTDQLHSWHDHAPWDAVWSSDPGKIMAKSDTEREIFIAPINTKYVNFVKNDSGKWVSSGETDPDELKDAVDLLQKSFTDAIQSHPESNLKLVDKPGPNTLVLEIALVELVPTRIFLNTAVDIGGVLLPGSKALEESAAVGAQAAGGSIAAGSIAIEMKLTEFGTGNVVAEVKDRQSDPASILPNYRDFERLGWSRKEIGDWSTQFVEVFSTPQGTEIDAASDISLVPW